MIYISITNFELISQLEKDHSIIGTCRLKNVIFFQKIISFVYFLLPTVNTFKGWNINLITGFGGFPLRVTSSGKGLYGSVLKIK